MDIPESGIPESAEVSAGSHEQANLLLQEAVYNAVETMIDLMINGSDALRLAAAKSILQYSGFGNSKRDSLPEWGDYLNSIQRD